MLGLARVLGSRQLKAGLDTAMHAGLLEEGHTPDSPDIAKLVTKYRQAHIAG